MRYRNFSVIEQAGRLHLYTDLYGKPRIFSLSESEKIRRKANGPTLVLTKGLQASLHIYKPKEEKKVIPIKPEHFA